ncbi:geminin-like [Culex pipiens pallens]|uniref:geminin-like n=1 Tax=Culex pipiens pallens TaxID=42434 RepID=UPI0022AAE3F6|nr:geminin-like [Culex pipiens pallens]
MALFVWWRSQSSQTSPEKAFGSKPTITEEDLTSAEGPSQQYWEVLAEKRRAALQESLSENMDLYEQLSSLKEELSTSKQMLQESRNIVEVLTELLQEDEAEIELRLGSTAAELAWKMTAALCRKYRATATTIR